MNLYIAMDKYILMKTIVKGSPVYTIASAEYQQWPVTKYLLYLQYWTPTLSNNNYLLDCHSSIYE